MDINDWFLKQRVTQGEMDGFQENILQGLGMLVSRGFGQEHGTANIRGGSQAGSIINGGEVAPAAVADKTVRGNYLIGLAASEGPSDPVSPPTSYDDGAAVPILAVHGTPNTATGFDAWTHDFTSIIGAITAGKAVLCRMYAVMSRAESDPRTDGDGNPVNFERKVDMAIEVDVGVEANPASAVAPTIREDNKSVHLALIGELLDTTTQITASEISNQDRFYNGLSLLGGGSDLALNVGRRAMNVLTKQDENFSVVDGAKVERLISGNHNVGYNGFITALSQWDVLAGARQAYWAFLADTDQPVAGPGRRVGRRRDLLYAQMEFMVRDGSSQVLAGYNILPLGLSDASDAVALTANGATFRYRIHNATGATIFVSTLCSLWVVDRRQDKFMNLSGDLS